MVDGEVFEIAWRAHGAAIVRYCSFSSGSLHTGQDLAADVFTRFLTQRKAIPAEKTEAWLFTVARNLCVSHHRAEQRRARLARDLAARVAPQGHEPTYNLGPDPALAASLAALSVAERQAIYLRLVEERDYKEVARALGRSEGATRMLVLRALRRLKDSLSAGSPVTTTDEGSGKHA